MLEYDFYACFECFKIKIVFLHIIFLGTSSSILGNLAALSNKASEDIFIPGDMHPPK